MSRALALTLPSLPATALAIDIELDTVLPSVPVIRLCGPDELAKGGKWLT